MTFIKANTATSLFAMALDADRVGITGLTTLQVQIVRESDRASYDWSDATWKAAGWTTLRQTLTQVDAASAPGLYYALWLGAVTGIYLAVFTQTATDAANFPLLAEMQIGTLGTIDVDAITSAAIAVDAIGAAQLAASAVAELQNGLATATSVASVQTDVDDIQGRLPLALVSGRIDASVGAMATNVVTDAAVATGAIDADALAASAVTAIQNGLATTADVVSAESAIRGGSRTLEALAVPGDAMDLVPEAVDAAAVAPSAVAELQAGLATTADVVAVPSATAAAILDAVLAGHNAPGTAGEAITRLDVAVSSRAEPGEAMTLTADERVIVQGLVISDATPFPGSRIDATVSSRAVPGDVMDLVAGAVDSSAVDASAVAEIQAGLATAAAVAALPTASQTAIAVIDAELIGHTAPGSAGGALAGIDVPMSSRAAPGDAMALTPAERISVQALVLSDATPFQGARIDAAISSRSSHSAADVWAVVTRTLSGIGSSGIASQASVSALPSAAQTADAVLDELVTDHTTANSVGARLALLDVAVSTRSTLTETQVDAQLSAAHGAGSWATATGFATPGDIPSAGANADAIWDEILSSHVVAGSAGATLSAAGGVSPPSPTTIAAAVWDELLADHGAAGSAGAAMTLVDVAVSSRAAPGDAMTLTAGERNAVQAGVWTTVWATPEGTPAVGTYGATMQLMRRWIDNRLEVSTTNGGEEILYDDDGSTPLRTWSLRDATGNAITATVGSPARRGAAT